MRSIKDSVENDHTQLFLEKIGTLGDTTAKLDGETINVFGGIPGEKVIARVLRYRRKRQHFTSAIVTQVLKPSKHRVSTPCPYFGSCTGCQWQHIAYEHQLHLKQNAIMHAFGNYESLRGKAVSKTLPSPLRFAYRNHARFTVRHGELGYVNRITRNFVRINRCMLMAEGINETISDLQSLCQETSQLSVRYGVNSGKKLVQPKLKNNEVPIPSGQTHYSEYLQGREFQIASPSFFQVNTAQAQQLALLVKSRLSLSGHGILIDAYAGVGFFSALLSPFVDLVIAIEESEAAVSDAKINTEGLSNVEFRHAKTEEVLLNLESRPESLILDPPRAGCHPDVLKAAIEAHPKTLLYVSCNPTTLARDLDILVMGGLKIKRIEPIDMFPHTHHVECVVTLGQS